MRKKYLVKDKDEGYEVEEITEEPTKDEDEIVEEVKDEESLTPEEISALKGLAAHASELVALIEKCNATDEDEDEDDEEALLDEDEDVEEDEEEEVVDTSKARDSKKSFGAIQKKAKPADSIEEDEVANAWAKRYGGVK